MSLPIVTSNVDAIIKHQAKYLNATGDIIIVSNGKRKVLLSAVTTGASLAIGPGGETDKNFGIGDDLETNFTTDLENIPVLVSTVSVKVDGVEQGTDDGAGNITGAGISTGTIVYATGALDVTFSSAPATDEIVSVTYTGFDADLYRKIIGTAPLDLSAFFKNAPFSQYKDGMGLLISPAPAADVTIAYVELKE